MTFQEWLGQFGSARQSIIRANLYESGYKTEPQFVVVLPAFVKVGTDEMEAMRAWLLRNCGKHRTDWVIVGFKDQKAVRVFGFMDNAKAAHFKLTFA